ncbi:hypothetical protein GDO81_020449 [Engystomops pustulosus]|uniref:Secreted protein n=1 Tax=Engystomops pustulosus TaxID=76066 RepID=A0AAV6YQQ6_ENGPU|nr:hypothetical protein GDO81_020449 [Engystomops pustulosus]
MSLIEPHLMVRFLCRRTTLGVLSSAICVSHGTRASRCNEMELKENSISVCIRLRNVTGAQIQMELLRNSVWCQDARPRMAEPEQAASLEADTFYYSAQSTSRR